MQRTRGSSTFVSMTSRLMSTSLFVTVLTTVLLIVSACGGKKEIQLRTPQLKGPENAPEIPVPRQEIPNDQTNADRDNESTPATGGDSTDRRDGGEGSVSDENSAPAPGSGEGRRAEHPTDQPSSPSNNNEATSQSPRPVLLCETPGGVNSTDNLQYLASDATSSSFTSPMNLIETKSPNDPLRVENVNIRGVRNPVGVSIDSDSQMKALLIGAKTELNQGAQPSRLYLASIDVASGLGRVQSLGAPVAVPSDPSERALQMGLKLRTHGASDQGQYLILPEAGKAYVVKTTDGLKTVGRLAVSPSSHFNPIYYEAQRLLVLQSFHGGQKNQSGRFSVRVFRVSDANGLNFTEIKVSSAQGLSQTSPILWPGDRLAWLETKSGRGGMASSDGARVVIWEPANGQSQTWNLGVSGRSIQPQIAAWSGSESQAGSVKTHVVLALEKISSGSRPRVANAEVFVAEPSGSALQVVHRLAYPQDVVAEIESTATAKRGPFSEGVFSTPDARDAYVVLPTKYGLRVYRVGEDELSGLAQEGCVNPTVTPVVKSSVY